MSRFVIFGAGAIGGVIGGRLFEHGYDVVLLARGAHHDAIEADGLTLRSRDETSVLRIPVAHDPAEARVGPEDVVIVAVKSQDGSSALAALSNAEQPGLWRDAGASVAVMCAQNGVENERHALRLFDAVYGLMVMCPASYLSPGVVQAHSSPLTGILDIGRYPSGLDDRVDSVAAAFRASTFLSEARSDIGRWKYGKLLTNLGNAAEAICGPGTRGGAIPKRAYEEGVRCLQAAGIEFVGAAEFTERHRELLAPAPPPDAEPPGNSSWQSLVRGTGSIETDYLNGEIVMLGRQYGVPTPVNGTLQRLANALARNRREPGVMTEAEFLAEVDRA
jgi:2-dehydropantoate 2-reductase